MLLAPGASAAEGPDELFDQANGAFARADYPRAIGLYRQALEMARSPEAHYNLANAYQKAGRIGEAVLHYEKALALRPGFRDARDNLAITRLASELPEQDEGWLVRTAVHLHVNTWAWLAAGTFWGTLALFVLPPLYGGGNTWTRTGATAGVLILAASLLGLSGYHIKSRQVVALRPESTLRVAPAAESPPNGTMAAGEIGARVDAHGEFVLVQALTGEAGWIHRNDVAAIWE